MYESSYNLIAYSNGISHNINLIVVCRADSGVVVINSHVIKYKHLSHVTFDVGWTTSIYSLPAQYITLYSCRLLLGSTSIAVPLTFLV